MRPPASKASRAHAGRSRLRGEFLERETRDGFEGLDAELIFLCNHTRVLDGAALQLLLVCLALPSLLVLARLRVQPALRLTGALLTGTAALGWLVDRLGLPNPVARTADSAGSHTTLMLTALMLTALTVTALAATSRTLTTRRRARPKPPEPSAGTTAEPHDRNRSPETVDSAAT